MNQLTNSNVLMAMFPIVADQVRIAEQSVLSGEGKRSVVVNRVKSIYQQTSAPIAFEALQTMLERMIEAIVDFYNSIGSFARQPQLQCA